MTDNDILKAIKISQALQAYFDNNPMTKELRSTDAYEVLVKKNLVETDRHSGIKFRKFLSKLKSNNALNLIPQCRAEETCGNTTIWYFISEKSKTLNQRNLIPLSQVDRIQSLNLEEIKQQILAFPKRNPNDFTSIQLGTREKYSRAFEYWTRSEEDLLLDVIKEISAPFKLSKLFGRQPSAIQHRLKTRFRIEI